LILLFSVGLFSREEAQEAQKEQTRRGFKLELFFYFLRLLRLFAAKFTTAPVSLMPCRPGSSNPFPSRIRYDAGRTSRQKY